MEKSGEGKISRQLSDDEVIRLGDRKPDEDDKEENIVMDRMLCRNRLLQRIMKGRTAEEEKVTNVKGCEGRKKLSTNEACDLKDIQLTSIQGQIYPKNKYLLTTSQYSRRARVLLEEYNFRHMSPSVHTVSFWGFLFSVAWFTAVQYT